MASISGGPLDGIKVLDLSRYITGPMCGMLLGDLGADVVKVERPGVREETRSTLPLLNGESLYFLEFNRNKRSITLNYRDKDDLAKLRRLAAGSRTGNSDRFAAPVNAYKASDERWVYLSAGMDSLFLRLVSAMEKTELPADPRFSSPATRVENTAAINAIGAAWVATLRSEQVVDLMDQVGVPCSKVATIDEVGSIRRGPPRIGEPNAEVYADWSA